MSADVEKLEAILEHCFGNPELLRRALTHKSRLFEQPHGEPIISHDNEQLEFLGDAVLGFLASEALVRMHPTFPEGRLSKLKAHLVSEAHLYRVAQRIGLGDFLILGRGEEMSGGREKKALLADAMEALIAALFLDGGMEPAARFVARYVMADHDGNAENDLPLVDFKSTLQETAQALRLPQPRYVIVGMQGPEHAKTFTVEVRVGREFVCQADGLSKKSAGQRAAELVLRQIQEAHAG